MAWRSADGAVPRATAYQKYSGLRAALVGHMGHANPRTWSGFGWQLLVLTPPALLYFLVRDLSANQASEAHSNAATIVDVERSLGLDWEAALQQRVLDTDWILSAVNWIYIWGHFPLILATLFLLFRLSRAGHTSSVIPAFVLKNS